MISGLSKDRHHEIFKKVVGTVIMLPSESSGVIVNHEESAGLRVSCIIKRTVRKAIAQWYGKNPDGERWLPDPKDFELETPTLMYTAIYGLPFEDQPPLALTDEVRRSKTGAEVALIALNESSEDRIMVKPYRIGNVYDGGNICWGNNSVPGNLREAHNLFWSSGINVDFGGGPVHDWARCTKINHVFIDHNTSYMRHRHEHIKLCRRDYTECDIAGKELIAMHGPWRNGLSPHVRCTHCRGLISAQLDRSLLELTTEICTLCICCIGRCSAESGCVCACQCCRAGCGCRCNCDLTDDWIDMMKSYQERLGDTSWEDWTRTICGRKWNQEDAQFFSYNGHCDAIFISYDKNLIERVGKKHVRKHHDWDAVIGLATIIDKDWQIDIGGRKFKLSKKKVVSLADMWESPMQLQARQDREYAVMQEHNQRDREEQRIQRQQRERERREREDARARSLTARIERGEVSERESAAELWQRFYLNEANSSWWQTPESLQISTEPTVVVGRTFTS